MRCGHAQKLIVAAVDGELTPERRRELDDHVAVCTDCRTELRTTETLFGALGSLPQEAEVPALVEAATLRRMRILAAEGRDRGSRRWSWLPAHVLAATGVAVLALVVATRQGPGPDSGRLPAPGALQVRQLPRVSDPAPPATKQEAVARADTPPPAEP